MQEEINNNTWDKLQASIKPELIQSLQANGFLTTMPVQEAGIPLLLKNYDLAVQAQTGSGKTLTFVVPIVQRYLDFNLPLQKPLIKFVVISPTRQLCQQTFEVIRKLIIKTPLKQQQKQKFLKYVKYATGGKELKEDIQEISKDTIILVGTVGRLKELGNNFESNWLKKVDYLYIDEADRVLKQKGIHELIKMFQKVRRTAMFSATLQGLEPKDYEFYGMRNLAKISVKPRQKKNDQKRSEQMPKYTIPKSLHNAYLSMNNRKQKIEFLFGFLAQYLKNAKSIIFFSTCSSVDYYTKLIKEYFQREQKQNCDLVYGIHGKLKNKRRARILQAYTEAKAGCLIATDVVSRGIDFDHVHYIIQVDPPEDPDNYIHRIGRTARINRPGTAILLIEKHEQAFINYLGNNGIGVQLIEEPKHFIHNYDAEKLSKNLSQKIPKIIQSDRDYIQKSKKAFVSYIRSYKQHDLRFIFQFKNLSIGFTAQSFFLLRIPRVKQILGKKIDNFVQSQTDPESIPWLNQNQSSQFAAKKQKMSKIKEMQEKIKQREAIKTNKSKTQIKNNKSKRKRIRQKIQNKEMMAMKKQYLQLKKQKKAQQRIHGAMGQSQQSDSQMEENSDDTQQIEKRVMAKYNKK